MYIRSALTFLLYAIICCYVQRNVLSYEVQQGYYQPHREFIYDIKQSTDLMQDGLKMLDKEAPPNQKHIVITVFNTTKDYPFNNGELFTVAARIILGKCHVVQSYTGPQTTTRCVPGEHEVPKDCTFIIWKSPVAIDGSSHAKFNVTCKQEFRKIVEPLPYDTILTPL